MVNYNIQAQGFQIFQKNVVTKNPPILIILLLLIVRVVCTGEYGCTVSVQRGVEACVALKIQLIILLIPPAEVFGCPPTAPHVTQRRRAILGQQRPLGEPPRQERRRRRQKNGVFIEK